MPRDRDDRYDDEDDRRRRRSRRDDFDDEGDDRPPPKKGMSTGVILAIVFGVTAVVALPCIAILIGLLLPAVQKVREAASRQRTTNDVKVLAIATHNYNDATGRLPLPFVPRTGEPVGVVPSDLTDRLSWRVAMLPYVEQDSLYRRFKTDEPWNSPANQPLAAVVVKAYADADDAADPATRYRCFYDNGAAFDTRRPARIPQTFMDGTANTILYVEGAEKVTWSRFGEYRFDPAGPLPPLGHPKRDVFAAAMVDGSVRWVKKSVSPQTLKAAITANGGEVLGPDW